MPSFRFMRRLIIEPHTTGGGRFISKWVDEAEFRSLQRAQCEWQLGRITQDQVALVQRDVPFHFWIYAACNSDPALNAPGCSIGTWWDDPVFPLCEIERDAHHQVYRMPQAHAKYFAVVDGRDEAPLAAMLAHNWDEDLAEDWRAWLKKALAA